MQKLLVCTALVGLVSCSDDTQQQATRKFVQRLHEQYESRKQENKPVLQNQNFITSLAGLENPFEQSFRVDAGRARDVSVRAQCLKVDCSEMYSGPIEGLQLVGFVAQSSTTALVKTSEGNFIFLRVGEHIGDENAQIVNITRDAITISQSMFDANTKEHNSITRHIPFAGNSGVQ